MNYCYYIAIFEIIQKLLNSLMCTFFEKQKSLFFMNVSFI